MSEKLIDHIVQHHATVAVNRCVQLGSCAQRRDHQGNFVLDTQGHVLLQAIVGLMHDLIDRKGRRRPLRVGLIPGLKRLADLHEPSLEHFNRPCVERGERSNHTGCALGNHQIGVRHDE